MYGITGGGRSIQQKFNLIESKVLALEYSLRKANTRIFLVFCWLWRPAVDKSGRVSTIKTTKYSVKNTIIEIKLFFLPG